MLISNVDFHSCCHLPRLTLVFLLQPCPQLKVKVNNRGATTGQGQRLKSAVTKREATGTTKQGYACARSKITRSERKCGSCMAEYLMEPKQPRRWPKQPQPQVIGGSTPWLGGLVRPPTGSQPCSATGGLTALFGLRRARVRAIMVRAKPCCCHAVAMRLPRCCHAVASHLPCSCLAFAMQLPCCCRDVA